MDRCINIQHPDFQNLIKESNLNPLILKSKVGVWQEQNNTDRFPTLEEIGIKGSQVNYNLKAVDILLSDRAKEVFSKGEKNKWSLDKILTELAIPKEQKKLLLDLNISNREDLALELTSRYGYSVEINTAVGKKYYSNGKGYRIEKEPYDNIWYVIPIDGVGRYQYDNEEAANKRLKELAEQEKEIAPTQHYSNLTVPGGTNYTENEISTPLITPSIKGHAQFSTDNGIGWFRSDDAIEKGTGEEVPIFGNFDAPGEAPQRSITEGGTPTKTRRILEIQSDLFQKGRDKKDLTKDSTYFEEGVGEMQSLEENEFDEKGNNFLQLLNKDSNWVTFFIKSIIQDSAKKGYEKVLFPKGETAAKIEGHETIADEIKNINERINKTKQEKEQFAGKLDKVIRFTSPDGEYVYHSKSIEDFKKTDNWVENYYRIEDVTDEFNKIRNNKVKEGEFDRTIEKLEQEKANLKSQGIEKLKPIEAFYEIKVGNILEKQFGKDNIKTITDEYGNEWREIDIKQERDLLPIGLGKPVFKGVHPNVIDTEDITTAEGTKGAASYDRTNNIIKVNRKLLKQKFEEKAWTKPRELSEVIDGNVVKSSAEALPENLFRSYVYWEDFVIYHEYQHSLYSRADFDKEFPGKTKGDYETEINKRALIQLREVSRQASQESTKHTSENPKIIPFEERTYKLYKHYNLVNTDDTLKVLTFKEAQRWAESNNSHVRSFFFTPRKIASGDKYHIFIAERPEDRPFLGKPIFTEPPIDNKSNFTAYYNYRRQLAEDIDRAYETYKIQNVSIKGTDEYKKIQRKFIETQTRLTQELIDDSSKINDANIVFSEIIYEIATLDAIISRKSPSEFANFKVEDRLETLLTLFEGTDIRGQFVYTGTDENGKPLAYIPIDVKGFKDFEGITESIRNLRRKYEASYEDVTRSIIETNPIHLANLERFKGDTVKLNEYKRSLEMLFNPQKDINILEQYLLGINSANDSAASTAFNLYEHIKLQEAQQTVVAKEKRLKELDYNLHRKNFDFDTFYEKDSHGIDTGNIINIFSKKWFSELSDFYDLRKAFKTATKETGGKKNPYRDMMNWLKVRADIIDFTKLKYFKDIYGEMYADHFTSTDSEMEAYENSLRERLGKYFDIVISDTANRLEEYQEARITREMKSGEFTDLNIKQDSPWEFLRNYNSTKVYKPISFSYKGEEKWTFVQPDHITFIPKETLTTSMGEVSTGFYNEAFQGIQKDSDAFEYWSIVKDIYSKHINPSLSSRGHSIGTMSYGKFLKDSIENLRTKDGNPLVQKALNELYKVTTEVFQDNRKIATQSEQVVRSYTDKSKNLIKKLKEYISILPTYEIEKMAWERGIPGFTGETVNRQEYRKELIDTVARYDVLSMYSKDLTKITLALSAEASVHRMRLETANIANLVQRYNATIKTPDGKDRSRSVDRVNSWVESNIYNRRDSDTMTQEEFDKKSNFGRILTDADKKIKKILLGLKQPGDREGVTFTFKGETYSSKNGKYFISLKVSENVTKSEEVSQETFESALGRMIEEELRKLGSPVTLNSIFNAMLKALVAKGLLINPKAGLFNRIEGTITNTIRDNEGSYWTTGNLAYAKKFMTGINLIRAFSDNRLTEEGVGHKAQVKTFIQIFEALGVYQDKKNELDRRDNMSRYRRIASKLDPYQWAVDLPEFKNQGEVVLSMLADMTIKDVEGNEYNFFDKESQTFPAFIPGTMELKPEFRTAENLGWETFHLEQGSTNQFFVAKVRIDDVIKRTQGNYSKLDSIKAQSSLVGRAAMLFMRWLPEHYQQRFMQRESDIIQGKPITIGRYRALFSNAPALSILATSLTFTFAGPAAITALVGGGTLVLPFILKRLMKNKLEVDKNLALNNFNLKHTAAIMQEVIAQTLGFPLKMAHTTVNVKPIFFKSITLDNLMSDENSGMSEAEARALKGMSQEIANILATSLLLLAVKALMKSILKSKDDDDEDDSFESLYFGVSNMGDRLIKTFTAWADPSAFVEQNSKIAIFRALDDVKKLAVMMTKLSSVKGEDLAYQINKVQPIIPLPNSISSAIFKGQYPFFDVRDYNPDWMDKMLKTSAERAKNEAVVQRKEFREDLEKEYEEILRNYYKNQEGEMPDRYEIREEAKNKANKVIRKTYNKKGETQEETLKRIEALRKKYEKLSEE